MLRAALALALTLATAANAAQSLGAPSELAPEPVLVPLETHPQLAALCTELEHLAAKTRVRGSQQKSDAGTVGRAPSTAEGVCEIFAVEGEVVVVGGKAQFLSHDPIGYADSYSLYAFAAFDPINNWDPFGLSNANLANVVPGPRLPGRPGLPLNPNVPTPPSRPSGPFQDFNPNPLPGAGSSSASLLEREAARRVTMTAGMRLTLLLGLLLPGNMGQGRTCAVPGECSGPEALNNYMRHLPGVVKPSVSEAPMSPVQPGGGYQLPSERPRQSFVEPTTRPDVLAGDRIRKNWQPTPYTGPGCGIDCEKASRQIQKQIGGTIGTITPVAPNPGLGEFDGAPTDWTFHKVVIKDGRVFDEFTGSQGQDPDAYKDRFKHKDAIDFPF